MPQWALVFIGALIAFDQLVKHVMLGLVFDPPTVISVASFFNLVPVWNRGISFGLFGGTEMSRWILVALALVIVVMLIIWLLRSGQAIVRFALLLVIGGALSNVIDRLIYGAVVDFIDIHAFGWHWPAFNIADMAIFFGTAMLLYDGLFGSARSVK
ncbi:MAG: signal peptidase II [Rhodospirillaceae bacterium]|mgnify:FL=1|nr:signal peptidase II [Rhodospirillaceae bacterium]|tara:strand:- start:707 stop:1174 length:468 start_codon:yes stop_codon:yes gene_type:complete